MQDNDPKCTSKKAKELNNKELIGGPPQQAALTLTQSKKCGGN